MATIDIRREHALSKEEARTRAEKLAQRLEAKIGIQWKWAGDNIEFDVPSGAAKGATGKVSVEPKTVRVEIDLPFLLRAMKGMVEGKVKEQLDKLVSGG